MVAGKSKAQYFVNLRQIVSGTTNADKINRFNFLVTAVNEHAVSSGDEFKNKDELVAKDLQFLPEGTLNSGLYGMSAGEYDLNAANTVRLNQLSTATTVLQPYYLPGVFGGEGQVGGRIITDDYPIAVIWEFLKDITIIKNRL